MKTLSQHISQVKTLHSLNEFINEKLVINKDFCPSGPLEEIKNAKWKSDPNSDKTTEDISVFNKFVEYIQISGAKEITFRQATHKVNKNKYLCGINMYKKIFVVYHKSDTENDLFEKISAGLVYTSPVQLQLIHGSRMVKSAIPPLNTRSAFFSNGKYRQYEISKETFEELVNLYEEL